MFLGDL